ncbi:MAG TPA: type I phosphomannose isomerase catalytic subunit [Thermomicrobiales bacterium]|nr:type I phosphomannose isomerase catalytic subunit [Thermomicrobiales bacterium]
MRQQGRTPGSIGYPLKMSGSLDPKPWGGKRLASYGKQLPDEPIGESLESGSDSLVTNGRFAGRTLGALAVSHPDALLGARGAAVSGAFRDFPLLVKLIDARENLSVQVHPDDALAPAGSRGKTEAWLVLLAEPGSRLIVGIEGALDLASIEHRIVSKPVTAGDVYFIPAGTVHAIGAGVLLYEAQQASDVTFRLYDWGRQRDVHIEEGLRASRAGQRATRVSPLRLDDAREMLVACRHFAIERWSVDGRVTVIPSPESFRVLTVLDGAASIEEVDVALGDTLVLPADLPAGVIAGAATVIVAYIPDLDADVVRPLMAAGHNARSIDLLGVSW